MSGYKRVNFYELCRLCASNQQKDKTHIFTEEGRKIQLQNKIQSCLSLNVCETDFLPKVVCSKCLRTLEVCYSFRQECVGSESMLSSYFKNFRYTEDFKKSGKVYIKDTTVKQTTEPLALALAPAPTPTPAPVPAPTLAPASLTPTPTTTTNTAMVNSNNYSLIEAAKSLPQLSQGNQMEHVPLYMLQLPIVTNQQTIEKNYIKDSNKIMHNVIPANSPQITYNLNSSNLTTSLKTPNHQAKMNETLSNVVVNSNGEVINIAQIDFDSIMNQPIVKLSGGSGAGAGTGNNCKSKKRSSKEMSLGLKNEDIVKIDLTGSDESVYDTGQVHIKYDKLISPAATPTSGSLLKTAHNDNKYTYSVKINQEEMKPSMPVLAPAPAPASQAPTVIFNNNNNNYHQNSSNAYSNSYSSNGHHSQFPAAEINIISNNSLATSICTNTSTGTSAGLTSSNEPSTVNLNILNQDAYTRSQQINPSHYVPQSKYNLSTLTNVTSVNVTNNNITANISVSSGESVSTNGGNGKTHVCEICHKVFKRKEHLFQHVKLHTGYRPFVCENCNKSFMRKEHLLRHMTSHSGQKNYTCNICEKSFSRNDNLLKHKKTHEKQSSFACEVCNKQFVMKHYYLAHKMTHEELVGNLCTMKA